MCEKISAGSLIFWAIPATVGAVVPPLALRIQELGINVLKQEDGMYKMLNFLADEQKLPYLLGGSLVLPAVAILIHDIYKRVTQTL